MLSKKIFFDPIYHDIEIVYFPSATGDLPQSCTHTSVANYVTYGLPREQASFLVKDVWLL